MVASLAYQAKLKGILNGSGHNTPERVKVSYASY